MKRWLFVLILALAGALLGAAVSQVAWGAPLAQVPAVPHEVAGREACLTCHGSGERAVPADHAGRADTTCLTCHQAAAPAATAGASPAAGARPIPHDVAGRAACLACHSSGNLAVPADHAGRAETTCLTCHQPAQGAPAATAAASPQPIPTVVVPTAVPTVGPLPTVVDVSPDEYKGPDFCAQCHAPHIEEWQGSTHAMAFEDPVFQQSWAENQKPGYCLQCHATGYNPNTGLPVAEGVTCESCHGTYKEGHPSTDMMPVDPAAARCGSCHETTYQEWQLSGHSQRNVKCASCHAVHSQGLLFPTSAALCATCHGDRNEDFAHSAHSAESVTCANCHMYTPEGADKTQGLAPTGHFFSVESQACTICHTRDEIHSRRQTFGSDTSVDVAMTQRVAALEEEVTVLNSNVTRNLILGLLGGAVGGLVLGAALSLLFARRLAGGKRGTETVA